MALRNLTFDDPVLLRSSCSADVLRQWGQVLDRSQDASDWDIWSTQTDHLDVFISHNWSMNRQDKFVILALHLNFRAAITCTTLTVVVTALLTLFGVLPTIRLLYVEWWSPWCQVAGSVVFLLALFCWQEVGRFSPWRGKLLFLDKACINQRDDDLKRRGIEHLAAFVYHSWSMLICYSDEYLQKLWTVYEVANFLVLHPGSALHIRHAYFAKFVVICIAILLVCNMVQHVLHVPGIIENTEMSVKAASFTLTALFAVPISITAGIMTVTLTRERMNISKRMERFRFAEAKCACEEDRLAVQRNIIAAMKHHGHSDSKGSDADIIKDFEAMIQSEVPRLFAASLGRVGFPYSLSVCTSLPYGLQAIDYSCAQLFQNSAPARFISIELAYRLMFVFAGVPLCLALVISVAGRVYSPERPRYKFNVFLLTALFIMFLSGSYWLMRNIRDLATQGNDTALIAFVGLVALYAASTVFIYRPIRYKVHHRRFSPASVLGGATAFRPTSEGHSEVREHAEGAQAVVQSTSDDVEARELETAEEQAQPALAADALAVDEAPLAAAAPEGLDAC